MFAFADMIRLNIMLYNLLNSEVSYSSINNSSNITSVSMLKTNYNQYHGLKLRGSEELILSSRLMKETSLENTSLALQNTRSS